MSREPEISVIIPTLNEAKSIGKTLDAIGRLVNVSEIVIVDGGSSDDTAEIVRNYPAAKPTKLIESVRANRGLQLNKGSQAAAHEILWFIHADTRPVQGSGGQIKKYLNHNSVVGGNFEVFYSGASRGARFLTWIQPYLHSMGLVYGDSGIFLRKKTFEELGGFRDYPIFEDLNLYRRMKKRGRFVTIKMPISTSSRDLENPWFPLIFVGWAVRQLFYWIGVPPRMLARAGNRDS